MKTTLELPDELMREIKIRAAREDRKLKDLVAELLKAGLERDTTAGRTIGHRVKLPLIISKPAKPGEELTPEVVAQLLSDEEAQAAIERASKPL